MTDVNSCAYKTILQQKICLNATAQNLFCLAPQFGIILFGLDAYMHLDQTELYQIEALNKIGFAL